MESEGTPCQRQLPRAYLERAGAGKGAKVPSLTIKTEMVDASNLASYVSPLDRHYTLADLPLVK